MKTIELFAGCGGLCLGLKKAGFSLAFANELSPMAAESFAYNMLGEDLLNHPEQSSQTIWLSSQYPRTEMKLRLREDPRTYPAKTNCDIKDDGSNLFGSLIVGNILSLNTWLQEHPNLLQQIREQSIDLVSGGPPCQSFSLAGLREKNNTKNSLPWAFALFAKLTQPKCVLLENVSGILHPFIENGEKYHAWFELAKTFVSIGYLPLLLHINAKFAGVAQNRPRFILIALRKDIFERLSPSFNDYETTLFASSLSFYKKMQDKQEVSLQDIQLFDLNKEPDKMLALFSHTFLYSLSSRREPFVSVKEAIDDIAGSSPSSDYVKYINATFGDLLEFKESYTQEGGHELSERVKRRFRIYQIASLQEKTVRREIYKILSGKEEQLSLSCWEAIKDANFLLEDGRLQSLPNKEEAARFLLQHKTKKQSQKALLPDEPAPTALSIPDDYCHYREIRTLTIREMARIQSFPDNYIFRSKTSTGGLNRRFEVPIYTQIGNAVPVLLGYALGRAVRELLERLTLMSTPAQSPSKDE